MHNSRASRGRLVSSSQAAVEIIGVDKVFGTGPGASKALDNVGFEIRDNEFFTLLGPSGCGKTTLLRLIAGFEETSGGEIYLYGQRIADLPPNKRPINTVFQHYALFPHLTVAENVGFGLRMLGRSKAEIAARVSEMLALVQLSAMAGRRPNQLSGGQQQRVALARALAPAPKVLLLDEPLSALDLKLRQQMRVELKQIQQETGITFVFVTHDQEEALTMSDRIAVMSAGRLQQVGQAKEIYEAPANRFVADFIGETNFIDSEIVSVNGAATRVRLPGGSEIEARGRGPAEGRTHISIRPERLSLGPDGPVACTVERTIYLGTDTQFVVRLADGSELVVRTQNAHDHFVPFRPGDQAALSIDPGAARVLAD
ncbi:MAG: ABC transporter ATP-binding protein [Pseudomonadota bacterium]